MAHLGGSVEPWRFGVLKGGLLKLREALTRAFERAVSKSNAQDFSCWCSLGRSPSELMKLEVKNRKGTRA